MSPAERKRRQRILDNSSHLAFGRAVYLRPAELHALGDGALEARFNSLPNLGPLKFSKGACYLKNELANWGRCVDGLLV